MHERLCKYTFSFFPKKLTQQRKEKDESLPKIFQPLKRPKTVWTFFKKKTVTVDYVSKVNRTSQFQDEFKLWHK
jgi:hypothetical protein